jgi:hypothetical protein
VPELGAVVLGISAYPQNGGGTDVPPLQFASSDATAVVDYLNTCWPGSRAVVRQLPELEATAARLRQTIKEIGCQGPYDLFFVYLSGHGVASVGKTGFLLQPENSEQRPDLIVPGDLDNLLSSVVARRTVFVLDCCFAEALVLQMPFFSRLDGSEARLFIASSRADQRTWEDERIGHGVFTAHMIDLLNTGSAAQLAGVRDQIQVDAELFPFLCQQVPLYVLERKAARQEPVKGGISTTQISLPIARVARRLRDRTIFGTALRRVRQILTGIVAGCVVALLLAYGLLWYPQLDQNDEIVLRNGTRWLEPLLQYIPGDRVHTGLRLADLSADPVARQGIQSGSITGVWTQLSRAGYRGWYDGLRSGLDQRRRHNFDALAGSQAEGAPDLSGEIGPSDVARIAWTLLSDPDQEILVRVLQAIPGGDRHSPVIEKFDPNRMDFNILDLTTAQLKDYAAALLATAVVDPTKTFPVYLEFLKCTQEWLQHNSDLQRGRGARQAVVDAVTAVLPTLAAVGNDKGTPVLDGITVNALGELTKDGYLDTVGHAVARSPNMAPASGAVAEVALSHFKGDTADERQIQALQVLTLLLDGSPTAKDLATRVIAIFESAGRAEDTFRTRFLIDAADRRSLPPSIIASLVASAREALERPALEFLDYEHLRILAHAMRDIPISDRQTVLRLVERVATSITPRSGTMAEVYGVLGAQNLDAPRMFDKVIVQVRTLLGGRRTAASAEPTPGTTIIVGGPVWAFALAQFAMSRQLNSDAIALLRAFADDASVARQVRSALAGQSGFTSLACDTNSCVGLPERAPQDSRVREISAELAALGLARAPTNAFQHTLGTLRRLRAAEVEPEYRMTLGRVIVAAQLQRFAPSADWPVNRK